jgi:hypothetical protein
MITSVFQATLKRDLEECQRQLAEFSAGLRRKSLANDDEEEEK